MLSARDDAPADGGDGSGRLREAAATWVRPAEPDEDGPEGAADGAEDASGTGTAADAPESGASGAQDGPGAKPEPGRAGTADEGASGRTAAAALPEDEAADAPTDAADASRDREEPGSAGSGTPAATADAPRAEDEPEDAARAASGTGTGTDAPKRAADASHDQDGPEKPGKDASGTGTDTDAPKTAAPADDAPRDEEGAEDATRAASGTGTGTDAPKRAADASGTGTDTDAPKTAGPADDAPRDEEGAGNAGTTTDAPHGDVTRGRDEAGGAAQDGPGADAEEGGSSGAAGTAKAAVPAGAAPAAREAAEDASGEDGDDRHDADGSGAADDAAGAKGEDEDRDGRPKAGGPVDQPTAVFRTGRPSAPAVDQPTTMLKLGTAGRETEAEAERTSKFVALKRDGDLGVRKPPVTPAAPTASLPQVGPERTTQQPLPPRPPLDLLAELTNTPPPPQTPLRTAVRRVKIWAPLVVLLAIAFAIVQAVRPLPTPSLVLTAEDTHTFDGDQVKLPWPDEGQGWMSGDGIGAMDHFGEQKPVAIGSVAKTMTAYIILREHPLKPGEEGPKIKVDAKAEEEGGYDKAGESTLNTVKAGDFLTEKQALSAVMIPSANNIARLLARWDAGSEEAFVKKMNDTAKELGMTDTTYTDPSGLKETTVSTAEDQTKLGIAAMRIPAMVAITSAASWTDPTGKYWSNYNELPYTMGAIGIKTGSTTKAGGNLLFAARKEVDGQTVIVVGAILGQHKSPILTTVNEVSKPALRAAQEALTSTKILKKGDVVGYVDDGLGGRTPVAVTEDVKAVGWAGLSVKLTFTGDDLPHTAKAGAKVGTLTVGDGSGGTVEVPVALQEDLVEPGFTDRLTRLS
ncbi:D-alanyl-D-alanine carboxypeptidase [Streptomyces sp. YIM B13518]|uniref:D-alanyl-D-alanine carboxypeptidase n=1 Tax=Streptomyces sp. YIM B13518 TaxID=3366316 RepID=UPI0036D07642